MHRKTLFLAVAAAVLAYAVAPAHSAAVAAAEDDLASSLADQIEIQQLPTLLQDAAVALSGQLPETDLTVQRRFLSSRRRSSRRRRRIFSISRRRSSRRRSSTRRRFFTTRRRFTIARRRRRFVSRRRFITRRRFISRRRRRRRVSTRRRVVSRRRVVTRRRAAQVCVPGQYRVGLSCGNCAAGRFTSSGTATTCTLCAAGRYSGPVASSCTFCAGGKYSGSGASVCLNCAAGKRSSGNTCVPCSSGTYSPAAGLASCTSCPTGRYAPSSSVGNSVCSQCQAGRAALASGSSSCSTLCGAGFYSAAGAAACSQCAQGSYSTGTQNAQCTNCPVGRYADLTGSVTCSPCAPGYINSAAGAQNQCNTPCAAGTFSAGGVSMCSSCAAGTYSASAASTCLTCTAGRFSFASASLCSTCDAGRFSLANQGDSCNQCGAGSYSAAGSSACTQCSAGSVTASPGSGSCAPCAPGKFQATPGMQICSTCPGGTYSLSGATTCITCGEGTVSLAGASACTTCAAGYQSGPPGSETCKPCEQGSTSVAQSSSCTPCPAGTAAPPNGVGLCMACVAGTYSASTGSTTCISCPLGTAMAIAGATTCHACTAGTYSGKLPAATVCQSCLAGSASSASASSCTVCPPGTSAPSTNSHMCSPCADGSYNFGSGNTACIQCPAAHFCNDGVIQTCPTGHYALAGVAECTACEPGYMCVNGTRQACPVGTYQGAAMATSCNFCPNGQYQPLTGHTECVACPLGNSCVDGVVTPCIASTYASAPGSSVCITCSSGTYTDQPGMSTCASCAKGNFCVNGISSPCVAGTYSHLNSAGASVCDVCPIGSQCPSGGVKLPCPTGTHQPLAGQTVCLTCTAGAVCQGGTAEVCPDGLHNPNTASTVCISCSVNHACTQGVMTPCPDGFYTPSTGASSCTPCPAGSYCVAGVGISPCAAGSFQAQTQQSVCETCSLGSACVNGVETLCAAGTYTNTTGASACETCFARHSCSNGIIHLCDEGLHQPAVGASTCVACPIGHYCTSGLSNPCPVGHSCNLGQLSQCQPGTFTETEGQTTCVDCPAAHYCANGNRILCEQGLYSANAGASVCSVCPVGSACVDGVATVCPAGQHQPSLGQWTCTSCPVSSSCNLGIATVCPDGSFTSKIGQSACLSCVAGNRCTNGATEPCPNGQYQNMTGASTCHSCNAGSRCVNGLELRCPEGTHQPLGGQTVCIDCAIGSFCTGGSSQVCPAGAYQSAPRMSSCDSCPIGFACNNGVESACLPGSHQPNVGSSVCLNCAVGHMCVGGANPQTVCAPGSYQPSAGASTCTTCPALHSCEGGATARVCGAGTYQDQTGQSVCKECAIGSYCIQAVSTLCPAGFYTDVVGQSVCSVCPVGSMCAQGIQTPCAPGQHQPSTQASVCIGCEARHYCVQGTQSICADGQYQPAEGASVCKSCEARYMCTQGVRTLCPNGYYQEASEQASCVACPDGYQCFNGTRTMCADGLFSDASTQFICSVCPAAHSCSSGIKAPCAVGLHQPASSQSSCLSCAVGSYCLGGVSTQCPEGLYTNGFGSTICSSCTPGSFCTAGLIEACPAGSYQAAGNATDCITCPVEHYCPAGAPNAIMCAPGFYQTQAGSSSCDSCNVGFACENGIQTQCGDVDMGGTYTNKTGEPQCLDCPIDGSVYCTNGLAYPCPGGYNCTNGLKEDIPECDSNNGKGDCMQQCLELIGSYKCHCDNGYYLVGNGTMPNGCVLSSQTAPPTNSNPATITSVTPLVGLLRTEMNITLSGTNFNNQPVIECFVEATGVHAGLLVGHSVAVDAPGSPADKRVCSMPYFSDVSQEVTLSFSGDGGHTFFTQPSNTDMVFTYWAPAPFPLVARFSDLGYTISVLFNSSAGPRTNDINKSQCSRYFSASTVAALGGSGATCTFPGNGKAPSNEMLITLASGATILPGDMITFAASNFGAGGVIEPGQAFAESTSASVEVLRPLNPTVPDIVLDGANTISACNNLELTVYPLGGTAGRPLTYTWHVTSSADNWGTYGTDVVELLASSDVTTGILIYNEYLESGANYTFDVVATNIFNVSSDALDTVSVLVSPDHVPSVTVVGDSASVQRDEELVFVGDLAISVCANQTKTSQVYTWSILPHAVLGSSRNSRTLAIMPGALNVSTTYELTLTVDIVDNINNILLSTGSDSTTISVVSALPEVIVRDGSHRLQSTSLPLLVEAACYDPNVAGGECSYTWSCMFTARDATSAAPCVGVDLSLNKTAVIEFEASSLALTDGGFYTFSVTASKADGRTSTPGAPGTSVTIEIVDDNQAAGITINPIGELFTKPIANSNERLLLVANTQLPPYLELLESEGEGEGEFIGDLGEGEGEGDVFMGDLDSDFFNAEGVVYPITWTMVKNAIPNFEQVLCSSATDSSLCVEANSLLPGVTYSFNASAARGWAVYEVSINGIPALAAKSAPLTATPVSPSVSKGNALETVYTISAGSWSSPTGGQLSYVFSVGPMIGGTRLSPQLPVGGNFKTVLPASVTEGTTRRRGEDGTIELFVTVIDRKTGAMSNGTVQVEILNPNVDDGGTADENDGPLSAFLNTTLASVVPATNVHEYLVVADSALDMIREVTFDGDTGSYTCPPQLSNTLGIILRGVRVCLAVSTHTTLETAHIVSVVRKISSRAKCLSEAQLVLARKLVDQGLLLWQLPRDVFRAEGGIVTSSDMNMLTMQSVVSVMASTLHVNTSMDLEADPLVGLSANDYDDGVEDAGRTTQNILEQVGHSAMRHSSESEGTITIASDNGAMAVTLGSFVATRQGVPLTVGGGSCPTEACYVNVTLDAQYFELPDLLNFVLMITHYAETPFSAGVGSDGERLGSVTGTCATTQFTDVTLLAQGGLDWTALSVVDVDVPINISIPLLSCADQGTYLCQYYNESSNEWTYESVASPAPSTPGSVVCQTSHLSSFRGYQQAPLQTSRSSSGGTGTVVVAVIVAMVGIALLTLIILFVALRRQRAKREEFKVAAQTSRGSMHSNVSSTGSLGRKSRQARDITRRLSAVDVFEGPDGSNVNEIVDVLMQGDHDDLAMAGVTQSNPARGFNRFSTLDDVDTFENPLFSSYDDASSIGGDSAIEYAEYGEYTRQSSANFTMGHTEDSNI